MGVDVGLFVDAIPSDCICTICSEVLEEPLETQACQHAFCKACITTWLAVHSSCPLCRQALGAGGNSNLRQLHRVWREKLYSLKVKCCYQSNGCDETMSLFQLSAHLLTCRYKEVLCSNDLCDVSVLRGELTEHLQTCQYRSVRCGECSLELLCSDLDKHKCVHALRRHFDDRMGLLKSELSQFILTTQQERTRMESLMEEQRHQIETLQLRITALINQRKRVRTPTNHLTATPAPVSPRGWNPAASHPVVVATETYSSSPSGSPLPPVDRGLPGDMSSTSSSSSRTERVNTSLPRLAPLHTHMSLVNRSAQGDRGRHRRDPARHDD